MFSRGRSLLAGAVLLMALWSLPQDAAAAPGYEESFRAGVRAGDLKKWQEAATRMAEAIAENPAESKKRIALSGVFSAPYIPHFYRGWFLYQQGTDHCEESLLELEASQEQGVVLAFKKQLEDLRKARESCGARVLPQAIEAAEKKIAAGETRLSAPLSLDDAALREKRRQARARLEAARASLKSGRQDSRLRSIQHAAAEAESVAETLAEIDLETARQSTDLLEAAKRQAERSLDLAERERQALTEALAAVAPDQRPANHASPEDVSRRLEGLRRALPAVRRTADLDAVRKLREEADSLRSALERSRAALTDAAPSAAPSTPPVIADTEDIAAAVAETTEPVGSAPANHETRVDPAARSDPSLVDEIRRLTESAELFLDRIGADDSGSQLLELQRSRLSDLVFEARGHSAHGSATTGALEALLGRLSDSLAALRLIAGAQAYFAGNPQQAVELLSASTPPASSLGAQFHLFLSASHFALFQVGLLENTGLAGADARRCRELDPELAPDPRAFSPSFRQFFADALAR